MDRQYLKDVENTFKDAVIKYISYIDYLQIASLFAPYDKYLLSDLELLINEPSNKELAILASNSLIDFLDVYQFEHADKQRFVSINDLKWFVDFNQNEISKTKLYYLLKLSFIIGYYKRLETRYDGKIPTIKDYEDIKQFDGKMIFRGQTHFEYRISPSIFRNHKKNTFFNDNHYYKVLVEEGLEQKFNQLIKSKSINRYQKYAFIQHSCSYSPLVDFTKNINIAVSFALSNAQQLNDFKNNDSAIFCLNYKDNKELLIDDKNSAKDFLIRDFNLKIIDSSYFVLGLTYLLPNATGESITICHHSISDLLDDLTPKIKIIDVPTNDRMLYQKGLFVCFYDCICLKDFIAYELNPSFVMRKIKIPKRNKRGLLNSIYHNSREYDPEHLMNPYLTFVE